MEFTNLFKTTSAELGIEESEVLAEIAKLKWHALPVKGAPFMQGEGIKGIIAQFHIPAKRVAWNGIVSDRYALLGIETKKQRMYFLDLGDQIVPVGLESKT